MSIRSKTVLHDVFTDLAKRFFLSDFATDKVDDVLGVQAIPYS